MIEGDKTELEFWLEKGLENQRRRGSFYDRSRNGTRVRSTVIQTL